MNNIVTDIEALEGFLAANPLIVVLTGAGVSLAAGIPTYRDHLGNWQHSEPVHYRPFLTDPAKRQRYWARSMRGWPAVRDAKPTSAHHALAQLERQGRVHAIITQNVDRLHQRADSQNVIDLHGRLDRVRCLGCGMFHSRDAIQGWLLANNAASEEAVLQRPDGDAELPPEIEQQFNVPDCGACGGTLIPDVVFFGDTVPRDRVKACMDAVAEADALISVGSSLQVFSGFRFCRRAKELGKPQAILNPGITRADSIAQLKVTADCQSLMRTLAARTFASR